MSASPRAMAGWVAALAVGAAVVTGLVLLGSPAEQRARRFDDRRLDDLRNLSAGIDVYFTRNGRVPETLAELPRELGGAAAGDPPNGDAAEDGGAAGRARDPETGELYEYEALGTRRYRLCATFREESRAERWGPHRDFWAHGAGRQCYEIEARRVDR